MKLRLSQQAGVQEYWIIEPENCTVRTILMGEDSKFHSIRSTVARAWLKSILWMAALLRWQRYFQLGIDPPSKSQLPYLSFGRGVSFPHPIPLFPITDGSWHPCAPSKTELPALPLLLEFLPFLHFTVMKYLLLPALYYDEVSYALPN